MRELSATIVMKAPALRKSTIGFTGGTTLAPALTASGLTMLAGDASAAAPSPDRKRLNHPAAAR